MFRTHNRSYICSQICTFFSTLAIIGSSEDALIASHLGAIQGWAAFVFVFWKRKIGGPGTNQTGRWYMKHPFIDDPNPPTFLSAISFLLVSESVKHETLDKNKTKTQNCHKLNNHKQRANNDSNTCLKADLFTSTCFHINYHQFIIIRKVSKQMLQKRVIWPYGLYIHFLRIINYNTD